MSPPKNHHKLWPYKKIRNHDHEDVRPVSSVFGLVREIFVTLDLQQYSLAQLMDGSLFNVFLPRNSNIDPESNDGGAGGDNNGDEPPNDDDPIDFMADFPEFLENILRAIHSNRADWHAKPEMILFIHVEKSPSAGDKVSIAENVKGFFDDLLGDASLPMKNIIIECWVDYEELILEFARQMPLYFTEPPGSVPADVSNWTLQSGSLQVTPWSQDPFIAMRGRRNEPLLFEPLVLGRIQDQFLVEQLTDQTIVRSAGFPFGIPGGQMLFGRDFVVLGPNVFRVPPRGPATPGRRPGGMRRISGEEAERLGKKLGVKKVYQIPMSTGGNYIPPFAHLDMYVTLGGMRWVDGRRRKLIFVGALTEDSVLGTGIVAYDFLRRQRDELDRIAGEFEKEEMGDFVVERFPVVWDDHCKEFFSYNNCLVETGRFGGRKFIYLPSYKDSLGPFKKDYARLEEDLGKQLAALGFKATFIKGSFGPLGSAAGSLRCLVKVLGRSRGWWL